MAISRLKYNYLEGEDAYEVIGYIDPEPEIEIPSSYNGRNVIKIAKNAFKNLTVLDNIIIPASITTIGANVFEGCPVLSAIFYAGTAKEWEQVNGYNNIDSDKVYYYSEEAQGGQYWNYSGDMDGFKISCEDNENMIDSQYFKVSQDGDVKASRIVLQGDLDKENNEGYLIHSKNCKINQSGKIILGENIELSKDKIKFLTNSSLGFFDKDDMVTGFSFAVEGDGIFSQWVYCNVERSTTNQFFGGSTDSVKVYFTTDQNAINDILFYFDMLIKNNDTKEENTMTSLEVKIKAGEKRSESNYVLAMNRKDKYSCSFSLSVKDGGSCFLNLGKNEATTSFRAYEYRKTVSGTMTKIKGKLIPFDNSDNITIGDENNFFKAGHFDLVYTSTGKVMQSDLNKKNTITNLSDAYSQIFDSLRPVTFKYNNGTSDRLHTGFIAQEVRDATLKAGLTTQDFAAYCEWEEGEADNKHTTCGLRYEEFIALCIDQIQKLKKQVAELEANIKEIKGETENDKSKQINNS